MKSHLEKGFEKNHFDELRIPRILIYVLSNMLIGKDTNI